MAHGGRDGAVEGLAGDAVAVADDGGDAGVGELEVGHPLADGVAVGGVEPVAGEDSGILPGGGVGEGEEHAAAAGGGLGDGDGDSGIIAPRFRQLWEDVPCLRELPYAVVHHALKYRAEALQGFLDGERGYPKWKNRIGDLSFTILNNVCIRDGRLAVPKVGWLRISRRGESPYVDARPEKAVIKRVGRRWCATVTSKLQGG